MAILSKGMGYPPGESKLIYERPEKENKGDDPLQRLDSLFQICLKLGCSSHFSPYHFLRAKDLFGRLGTLCPYTQPISRNKFLDVSCSDEGAALREMCFVILLRADIGNYGQGITRMAINIVIYYPIGQVN